VGELSGEAGGLDELSMARLAEGRVMLAGLVAERDGLVAAAVAERDHRMYGPGSGGTGSVAKAVEDWDWDVDDRLAGLPQERARCLLFALAERLSAGGERYSPPADWFHYLTQTSLGLVAGDVRLLAAVAEPGAKGGGCLPFGFVVNMVAELVAQQAGAMALAEAVADQVLGWNSMVYHWYSADHVLRELSAGRPVDDQVREPARLRDRALELAGYPPAPPPLEGPVSRDDGWGLAVIAWLGVVEDWPAGVRALLEHCAAARAARPGPGWEKQCRRRLAAVADAPGLLRGLLDRVIVAEPVRYLTTGGQKRILVGFNEQLIKGVVWAAGVADPPWLADVLGAVAARCLRLCSGHVFRDTAVQGEKIPNACFRALATSGSDASMTALARIGRATSNGSVLKVLARTLEEAAAKRGTSPTSMLEQLTPDHGLDGEGHVVIETETGSWVVRLDDRLGAVAEGPPGAEAPAEVAEAAAEIKATAGAVRDRLETLFADRREWHCDDFADYYVRHPLTRWLATRMAWTWTGADGQAVRGFPGPDGGTVITPHGTVPVPAASLVRIIHPVALEPDELDGLRRLCQDLAVVQPIRQLWRETYRLTDAERKAALFTGRHAGHVLRFKQAYGLARRRGWTGGFLSSTFDGGDSAVARRDYPSAGLRASWALAELDHISHEIPVDLCITENLSFSPLHDTVLAPVPLADVPADVFSEAMRDLDLVVSVATVANDPAWLEAYRGQPLLDQYWERVASGGLDQSRVQRHAMLVPYYDSPAAGQRFQLTSTDLIVHGSLATYRIDLATANVRTEPDGRWLSFDTKLTARQAHDHHILGLPAMDDDEILHRILIRAAILADDELLASRKLLKQIRG
jgi:hypothetical protein